MLEVRILDVKLRQDWGFNIIRPLAGTLQDDFHEMRLMHIPLDEKRNVGRLPWGLELPLAPFFGIMGVAPPKAWGRITSIVPRAHGGNLDNKELVAGATLYLPVFVEGGLFSCGDGHGAQGDGEVCITAIETALQGTFEIILREDLSFAYPRAETPKHYITMGMDPDLDQCVVIALRDMIKFICERTNLSKEDAYTLCSLAADLHVTQTVNGSKGIHVMLREVAPARRSVGRNRRQPYCADRRVQRRNTLSLLRPTPPAARHTASVCSVATARPPWSNEGQGSMAVAGQPKTGRRRA